MISSTSQPAEQAPLQSDAPAMDKIIVAIHGIGSQRRSDTIRAVARHFGSRSKPPLPVMPLGFFQMGKTGEVHLSRLETSRDDPLARIGFAEVFWADIPRAVVQTGDTLEETKAWGASVVSRVRAAYVAKPKTQQLTEEDFTEEDFTLGASVIEEIVETIRVLENLLVVAEKAGVFKFDLAPLLRDYIGDVQLVTEFKFYREKILYRFHSVLSQITEAFQRDYPNTPEIYIVAHSEGTVVSFLGLLQALSVDKVRDPDDDSKFVNTSWIRYVRGFMTIGSPIGKHIMLWPNLWVELRLACNFDGDCVVFDESGVQRLKLQQRIKWRNYYDVGDPIASKLDAASDFLDKQACRAFELGDHDYGFSRYWLPGKAHTDYWGDAEVFGHFIDDVVFPNDKPAPGPPVSRRFVNTISTLIPYVLTIGLHLAAVFVLFEGIVVATSVKKSGADPFMAMVGIFLLGCLLSSITFCARLPHLVKPTRTRWHAAGERWLLLVLAVYTLVAIFVFSCLPEGVADYLCSQKKWLQGLCNPTKYDYWKLVFLFVAFLAAASGWVVPRRPHWGRRTLIAFATFFALVLILKQLSDEDVDTTAWPVAVGGLAFIYIWWLGIMLFDLTFVWHRYVRKSVAIDTLFHWHSRQDARPSFVGQEK